MLGRLTSAHFERALSGQPIFHIVPGFEMSLLCKRIRGLCNHCVTVLGVTLASEGLARYEHAVAFALAVFVVYAARRWSSVGDRLRLLRVSGERGL